MGKADKKSKGKVGKDYDDESPRSYDLNAEHIIKRNNNKVLLSPVEIAKLTAIQQEEDISALKTKTKNSTVRNSHESPDDRSPKKKNKKKYDEKDNESDHIKQRNKVLLSPESIIELTSTEGKDTKSAKKTKSITSSGKTSAGDKSLQQKKNESISSPSNEIDGEVPGTRVTYREARRRRDNDQNNNNDADDGGYLDDEVEIQEDREARLPGAVRVTPGRDVEQGTGPSSELFKSKDAKSIASNASSDFLLLPQADAVSEMPIDEEQQESFRKMAEKEAEDAFLSKVRTAEIVGDKKLIEKKKRNQKWMLIGLVLLVLVIVGVVVAVVVSTIGSNDSNEDSTDDGMEVDPSTFDNITVTEDTCDNAISISSPTIVTGSTVSATADNTNLEACGDLTAIGASAVWYSFRGSGKPLSLNTCFGSGFDTQISVFSGDSCSSVTCVGGNDQRTNCGTDGSHFTFFADNAVQYYLLVHGLRRANGVFTLAIDELVDNSQCSNAVSIKDSNPTGELVFFGTTKFSTTNVSPVECFDAPVDSPGVWYSFLAETSRFVQARLDDIKGRVTVYTGSCNELQCVASDSKGMTMWTAISGVEYKLIVHGEGKDASDFSLTILPGGLLRPDAEITNNQCELSFSLPTPSFRNHVMVNGTSERGMVTEIATGCGRLFDAGASPAMWYSVVGNGKGLRVSTCDTNDDFIAQVAVYRGSCDNLACIGGGDQNCGEQSAVAWIGEEGEEYYILVQGLEGRVGDFNLTVEELIPDPTSDCNNPVPVPLDGVSIIGSTLSGSIDNIGLCRNVMNVVAPSVWYKVFGTGSVLIASTCDLYLENLSKIEVYYGNCQNLVCADVRRSTCGNQESLAWESVEGETYLIQVYGSGTAGDEDFALKVEEVSENYECNEASEPFIAGSFVRGATLASADLGTSGCSQSNEIGTWYKIRVPIDQTLTVSPCSHITTTDIKLTLFQGSACNQLQCISSNNGRSCSEGSFITWDASRFEVYHLLVQASGPHGGNFELTLGIENDICHSAIALPSSIVIPGSTQVATVDDGDLRCFESGITVDGPGIWYSVMGGNSLLKATVCSPVTTFDASISVFEGSCEELNCIAGEHGDNGACGSSATWFAAEGKTYYILVHGLDVGDFALEMNEVENNSCLSAKSVPLTRDYISVVSEIFVSENFVDPCTGDLSANQVGSWYSMSGTGGFVSINACSSSLDSNQGSYVSVYRGGCSELTCVEYTNDNTCSVTVKTTFGEEYYVYVSNETTLETSTYGLEISSSNDRCESAFGPLSRGDVVLGSTLDATTDDIPLCGDLVAGRGTGVWYTFEGGTGEELTFFTCSEFTDFDTQISLYIGDDCGNLSCIASRDDNCGFATWMTHPFQEGNRYYILISGKPENEGNFVLQVL
jgi:hypothetical protein